LGWWILLHLVLALAVFMANLPYSVAGLGMAALAVHYRLRYPVCGALLLVSGHNRFALPCEGRFDLDLSARSRLGGFWAELVFTDRPNSTLLLVRDQLSEPDWRRLGLILREGG
jgi:hypothetical protein